MLKLDFLRMKDALERCGREQGWTTQDMMVREKALEVLEKTMGFIEQFNARDPFVEKLRFRTVKLLSQHEQTVDLLLDTQWTSSNVLEDKDWDLAEEYLCDINTPMGSLGDGPRNRSLDLVFGNSNDGDNFGKRVLDIQLLGERAKAILTDTGYSMYEDAMLEANTAPAQGRAGAMRL